ncbi:Arm DNA-binding domain-containing protein [Aneurinibacillus aneurinilyticus]|uniref:AP2-like integrase N-terminal domain-containing protein n=1 Tax=Aneurinibacillus aneurinilyticus ATCC 12856 TaxID=649747 RepID=U1Y339_ANEAE|nr:Arm DNA-binding domain-containing protein [Aneurinibacillus aneurinilyticus]ERI06612.1 hypothetical protein HMPREF0083_05236 [Aneurinibacillus aneurinilyticus ATCC 12856]MED0707013.1 Arm DNA-binding domain-containing protein [Aneurinibacillus aneurinilyticus]MED0723542.1 Arm DNA-binding domain-containing protein [Aneurinibacillus aneurinilyticus]MED0732917.1 Arm DNA-binding domain-containing protein [Aneurinibacillus aneurinilyticus]MED0740312.1 Arm DNA-binding domain-containing protein [An
MKGYFRKRGSKWSFSIDIGRDPGTGKRKQKTVSGFKTKKEAVTLLCMSWLFIQGCDEGKHLRFVSKIAI